MTSPVLDRLDDRSLRADTGCLVWTGCLNSEGYGVISVDGVLHLTHRVAYAAVHGPIPAGLEVDHTCHNEDPTCPGGVTCVHRACREVSHLEAVTHVENVNRMGHGSEQRCKHGHPLTGSNVLVKRRGARKPVRNCRTCRDDRDAGRPR